MTVENQHRLLKRQLKKYNISADLLKEHADFFAAVNQAYKSSDEEMAQLENTLELSSKELYIANKKESERASKLSDKLDRIVDNVTDIIYEMDSMGNFTYLNHAWENYGEESAEESIGKNYMEFADRIEYFDTNIQKQISERDFRKFKTVYSRYNNAGKLLWWEMSVKLLAGKNGEILGAVGSLVDVTSLKETQQQLMKAIEAKGNFLSTMSHEIRTPLNAVIAISNILLMESPKESQIENLNALKFSSKHLLNLINDILDYNKMTTGNLRFAEVPFNLRYVLEGIVNSYSYSAEEKGIKLSESITSCVPYGVVGDNTRLSQVLSNLISNAIKFTSEGTVKLSVNCIEKNDETVILRFTVKDTGIGIAKDKLDFIFERFTQAENDTSLKYGGTGLGLAISKKIINLLGSDIYIESEVGKGTTFWFDLEYGRVERKSLLEFDDDSERKFDLKGIRLLIVDDNEMNMLVVTQFFDKWNVVYHTASNGLEAFEKARDNDYSLVLMDLRMPVMDGYTSVNKIRAIDGHRAQVPIIALTASVSSDVIMKVTQVGMNDYLSKPFDPVDLYAKVFQHALKKNEIESTAENGLIYWPKNDD